MRDVLIEKLIFFMLLFFFVFLDMVFLNGIIEVILEFVFYDYRFLKLNDDDY